MRKKTTKKTKLHFAEDATAAERKKVLALRERGLAFHAISAEMGWRGDPNGSRAYRIIWAAVRAAKDPAALGERLRLRPAVVKARTA
jgi:hypothetical protein